MLSGTTETERAIKCLNRCGEKLQFHAMDQLSVGMVSMHVGTQQAHDAEVVKLACVSWSVYSFLITQEKFQVNKQMKLTANRSTDMLLRNSPMCLLMTFNPSNLSQLSYFAACDETATAFSRVDDKLLSSNLLISHFTAVNFVLLIWCCFLF